MWRQSHFGGNKPTDIGDDFSTTVHVANGTKRTFGSSAAMAANDPKRTSGRIRGTNVMECVVWSFRLSTGTSTGTASVDFASIISIGALPRAATSDGCLEPLFLSVMAALFDLRQAK